jgi:hypothetical protein
MSNYGSYSYPVRRSILFCKKYIVIGFYQAMIPFVILYIRMIQRRYKRITVCNGCNQSNQNLALALLLQSKEYYYEQQFSAWGRYHPNFCFNPRTHARHKKFIDWLFKEKDFKEFDIVVHHNPRAVTYYHNVIFKLNGMNGREYTPEIKKQLKKWKKQWRKDR